MKKKNKTQPQKVIMTKEYVKGAVSYAATNKPLKTKQNAVGFIIFVEGL